MEFYIKSSIFNKAIAEVSSVITQKTTLPVLTGIKLTAEADGLTLTGSNSEIIIYKKIPVMEVGDSPVTIQKTGSIVLPAKYISQLVKKLHAPVHLFVKDHFATLTSGDIITRMNGFDSLEYPNLPSLDGCETISMDSKQLMEMIRQTVFAVSSNETRPVLNGVNIQFSQDEAVAVATNSHRLALRKQAIPTAKAVSCTIPSKALVELMKITGTESPTINLYITEGHIAFEMEHTTLYARLIEGNYPDTEKLFPSEYKTSVTLNTLKLLQGIDRASLFASEWKHNNVRLSLKETGLKISSTSTEVGEISETQSIHELTGDKDLTIHIDGNFLMDALKQVQSEQVKVQFGGSMRPIVIQPVGDDTYLHLISPVRSY
ncbi:DNA polymerase III subunit beta [Thalassobacillus hwangdonensis]|uniref:Beta sliding clamp n=1 Tax=Thalassobacillus hwangdonensis TaxID=546108 RepID=A0ABW3L2U9_9BACI